MIESLLQRHAVDLAFLWLLREHAVEAPHYRLSNLAELDERLDAHADGLRLGGDVAWAICEDALFFEEPGEVFAAAFMAVDRGDLRGFARALDVGGGSPDLGRALVAALAFHRWDRAVVFVDRLLSPTCPPALRRLGLAACAAHRHDPGPPLAQALLDADPALRACALSTAGKLGRADLLGDLRAGLRAADEEIRRSAAIAGALLGEAAATPVLWRLARGREAHPGVRRSALAERAAAVAARCGDAVLANKAIDGLTADGATRRAAIAGAGALGDPGRVPWLLDLMREPELARLAGEAFTMITGVDLSAAKLEARRPAGAPSGPTDDPKDERVTLDPDVDLPWPALDAVRAHWARHAGDFAGGARYLLGRPIAALWLEQVLRDGRQRQRAAAAIELARLRSGLPLFDVRAPVVVQRRLLAERAAPRST